MTLLTIHIQLYIICVAVLIQMLLIIQCNNKEMWHILILSTLKHVFQS